MNLLRVEVDADSLFRNAVDDLERRAMPFALVQAINGTAFAVRQRWGEIMPRVFDRPTPLTVRAVLYRKASANNVAADIFIRDEAAKGTPPAKYLEAQVLGGTRRAKAFEKRLRSAGILGASDFAVPGKGAQLDPYGNLAGRQLNAVLSQLGARFDPQQNETEESRTRRRKRLAKRGERRGDYFAVPKTKGRLAAGIYQRISTAFGSAVASILRFVPHVSYRPRYHIHDIAAKVHARRFPEIFKAELAKSVERVRGWS